ncbi:hypothetical protein ACFB49_19580 [Sphingomonas sp. DBB INV C78]|uniref:MliC family protein n=1 Tax=Sphingomonas sp. DBB INV C78 TaxID=3349434 RepID=UPI0036D213E0
MNHTLRIAPISILALLAACNSSSPSGQSNVVDIAPVDTPPETNIIEAANAVATEPPAGAVREVTYACTPAMTISARYDNSNSNDPEVKVSVGDKSYKLDLAPSASGARYFTEHGRSDDMTLTWWTKGPEATLYEGKKGGNTEEKKIATCREAA